MVKTSVQLQNGIAYEKSKQIYSKNVLRDWATGRKTRGGGGANYKWPPNEGRLYGKTGE